VKDPRVYSNGIDFHSTTAWNDMKLRRIAMLIGVVGALTATTAIAAEITLFEQQNFAGRRMKLRGALENLDRTSFNDRASSIIIRSGIWELCSEAYFRGNCRRLGPGQYAGLGQGMNDTISSLRPVRGYDSGPGSIPNPGPNPGPYPPPGAGGGNGPASIQLFERREFGGRSITLTKNAPNFENFGFNDRVDAAIVRRGVWRLCTDARMQGNCRDFGPGRYNDLGPLGGKVSSAAILR
jgi:hypothetical protein